MGLQYDPAKAASNFKKHGVSFADAEGVFYDPLALNRPDPDADTEDRFVAVGLGITGDVLVVVYTIRGEDIRLISDAVLHVKRLRNMRAEYDFTKGKRGAVLPTKGKTRITIHIDNAVLDEFRARAEGAGTGYQTMMNEALKAYLSQAETPVTESVLRRVIREEVADKGRLTTRSSGRATKRRAA